MDDSGREYKLTEEKGRNGVVVFFIPNGADTPQ